MSKNMDSMKIKLAGFAKKGLLKSAAPMKIKFPQFLKKFKKG